MSKKPVTTKAQAEKAVKDIRRATRKVHSAEEKIRQMLLSALSPAKVQPAGIIEINDREASREAVAFGLGVGIMSVIEFPTQDDRTVPITIDDKDLTITEYIACLEKKRKHGTVAEFIRIANGRRQSSGHPEARPAAMM